MRFVSPSIKETAFNCPHCYALARQNWFTAHADKTNEDGLPNLIDSSAAEEITNAQEFQKKEFNGYLDFVRRSATGVPFFFTGGNHRSIDVQNLWFSRCYNCKDITIWLHDRIIYPRRGEAPPATPDMPEDIRRDYDEAGTILDLSPRGAAALIRLAIQKLCKELGQPGKNLNDDIGALVKGGLDPRIQQALDVVRVLGNSAVHPGQIDLRDDRATAETLFKLLNLIVEKTISEPKHVKEVFDSLPESQLKAIAKRDGKAE